MLCLFSHSLECSIHLLIKMIQASVHGVESLCLCRLLSLDIRQLLAYRLVGIL